MSKIRSESELEKQFRKKLSAVLYPLGFRYKKNYKGVPGKPDVAFVSKKLAIFVDGDFWHGYDFKTRRKKLPKVFWRAKIENNMKRDRRNRRALTKMGWRYIRFWEHDVKKKTDKCIEKVVMTLRDKAHI